MKQFLLSIAILSSAWSYSQNFTWMRGSTTSGTITGVYGTQGVSAPGNDPGSRHGAATWTDASGNLWLFGGEGISSTATLSWLNDLWKYNITTNEWTWIRGSNTPNALGIYGNQGTPAAANDPGAREFAFSWTDASGNFWLFGGDGFGASTSTTAEHLNDLWKYDPTTNQWTYMKGSAAYNQNGNYGSLNVASVTNLPGARHWGSNWTESGGILWLFGGKGLPATGTQDGYLSDLWKYNIATNQWTWVSGPTAMNQNGTYGTVGVPSSGVFPGGREFSASWADPTGNFYLHGGVGYSSLVNPNLGYLNDLWKYNTITNMWTWLSGSNNTNQWGLYGTLGAPSTTNAPGGRHSMASWRDFSGNLWLFGGFGFGTTVNSNLNDLWKYNLTTNEWTWMKGANTNNQAGVYGTMGVSAASNIPGARHYITHWKTTNNTANTFWLFGSLGADVAAAVPFDNMNDLWGYAPSCTNPDSIKPSLSSIPMCVGNSITLIAYTNPAASNVQWWVTPTGGALSAGNGSVLTILPTSSAGTQTYYVESNYCTTMPRTMITITVNPLPTLSISATNTLLCGNHNQSATLSVTGAQSYTWSNSLVSSTMIYTTNINSVGSQTVTVTGKDANGCKSTSSIKLEVMFCGGIGENSSVGFSIYPNPGHGELKVNMTHWVANLEFIVINALGQKVYKQKVNEENNSVTTQLPSGLYFYQILENNKEIGCGKLIIE